MMAMTTTTTMFWFAAADVMLCYYCLLLVTPTCTPLTTAPHRARFDRYLKKTYAKTASLLARSCRAVAVLGEHSPAVQEIAYEYGRAVGMAFQVCRPPVVSAQLGVGGWTLIVCAHTGTAGG